MRHPSSQDLLLRAYHLSLLHGMAPMLSLQRSRVIPKDYQLVPVVIALEMPRVRMLITDGGPHQVVVVARCPPIR